MRKKYSFGPFLDLAQRPLVSSRYGHEISKAQIMGLGLVFFVGAQSWSGFVVVVVVFLGGFLFYHFFFRNKFFSKDIFWFWAGKGSE